MFEAFVIWLVEAMVAMAGPTGVSAGTYFAIEVVANVIAYSAIIGAGMAASRLLAPKMPSMSDPV